MSKKTVAVQIAGSEYKIRSDSDGEALRQIALYVDRSMQRVREGTGTVDSLDVAVLTCLNLAREILTLKEQKASTAPESSLRALIERVEAVFPDIEDAGFSSDASESQETMSASQGSDTLDAAPTGSTHAESGAESSSQTIKTLDLPSVETLRERAASHSSESRSDDSSEESAEDSLPEARMAAGGRDRAS
jgi:cell division protein ZapA (FtsZ GTPase activity inhibitor)